MSRLRGARNLLLGAGIAAAIALTLAGARVGRIDVWKILAALVGLWIYRAARD
jgi:hypothetical protein